MAPRRRHATRPPGIQQLLQVQGVMMLPVQVCLQLPGVPQERMQPPPVQVWAHFWPTGHVKVPQPPIFEQV
jgi:hypothetical protein